MVQTKKRHVQLEDIKHFQSHSTFIDINKTKLKLGGDKCISGSIRLNGRFLVLWWNRKLCQSSQVCFFPLCWQSPQPRFKTPSLFSHPSICPVRRSLQFCRSDICLISAEIIQRSNRFINQTMKIIVTRDLTMFHVNFMQILTAEPILFC